MELNNIACGCRKTAAADIGMMSCQAAGEYPSLEGLMPDARAARMLQTDFAGSVSETTAVLQYTNHKLVSKPLCAEISDVLSCIAKVEMRHLALIGGAIVKLGGSPVYCATRNGRPVPWQQDFVKYEPTVLKMLESDIQSERDAIAQYRQTITLVNCPALEALILRIIQDEEVHIQILTTLLQFANRPAERADTEGVSCGCFNMPLL